MFDGEKRGRPSHYMRVLEEIGDFRRGAEFDVENMAFMLQNAILPEGMRLLDCSTRRVMVVSGREIPEDRNDARGWGSQSLREEEILDLLPNPLPKGRGSKTPNLLSEGRGSKTPNLLSEGRGSKTPNLLSEGRGSKSYKVLAIGGLNG